MEISKPLKLLVTALPDTAPAARNDGVRQNGEARPANRPTEELPLEQLQQALRDLPDVDMERVQAIKKALLRGEISVDSAVLARAILAYHRGSEV